MNTEDLLRWYDENEELYKELTNFVEKTIKNILTKEGLEEGIEYALVDSRLKSRSTFLQKMYNEDKQGNRKYSHPTQLTDIAAARIVGYLVSDLDDLHSIVERYFDIDDERTDRPSGRLNEDQVGFRSTNYVAKLREETFGNDPQYQNFKDKYFEIQAMTILNFTWAQIQHDRVYKTNTEFPKDSGIQRKFKLLSGLLEIADGYFETLSKEVKQYDKTLIEKIEKGELEDLVVSPRSLRLYLRDFLDIPGITRYFEVSDILLDEIRAMGISKISQLHNIIPKDFKQRITKVSKRTDFVTYTSILRNILVIRYRRQYAEKAYKPEYYNTFDRHSYRVHKEFGVNFEDLPDGVQYDDVPDYESN
jgi:ppGpp synthetase/RelA/SpoT-type nucleotidyltranferase